MKRLYAVGSIRPTPRPWYAPDAGTLRPYREIRAKGVRVSDWIYTPKGAAA
jgi:hypothetical protein